MGRVEDELGRCCSGGGGRGGGGGGGIKPPWGGREEPLLLQSLRSHDQYNTTIYGLDDRYRGVFHERRVVFMHPDDVAERGLKARQVVDLTSWFEGVARLAPRFMVVPYDLPRGCAAAYFPEANALVPVGSYADESRTPNSKSVAITVAANPAAPPA